VLLFAALAAVVTQPAQARASVRIVQAQRVTKGEWQRSSRRREIVVREGEHEVKVRLIEFE
jgi:hypothetical protein